MNKFAKKLGITMLTAATALAPLVTAAEAGDRNWRYDRSYNTTNRNLNYREYSDRMQQNQQRYVYRQRYAPRDRIYRGNQRVYRHRGNDDAIALGIIGLGVGAIIGGAIANSYDNPRVIYQQPAAPRPVRGGYLEPWTQSWFTYCDNQYRSFNASTGTYRGYDGNDHFCVAK